MTEPSPTYTATPLTERNDELPSMMVKRVTPMEAADMLTVYFIRRREALIQELRELDRLLGREQTVPVRDR